MAAVPVELNKPEGMIGHNYFPENKNDKIYISSFILMNAKLMRENNAVARFFDVIRKMDKRLKFFDLCA